tara:strand:+ start:24174 stop:24581 length:408 start_codon:yes stop_codon:yes gene_type:complete
MATTEERILSYLNNSREGDELPVLVNPSGTEFNIVYNPSTDRLERILISTGGNFITINDTIFRFIKGYNGSVKNTGVNLQVNDFIANAVIRSNGYNLFISNAKFLGGNLNNFGTYNPSSGEFDGSDYQFLEYTEI